MHINQELFFNYNFNKEVRNSKSKFKLLNKIKRNTKKMFENFKESTQRSTEYL